MPRPPPSHPTQVKRVRMTSQAWARGDLHPVNLRTRVRSISSWWTHLPVCRRSFSFHVWSVLSLERAGAELSPHTPSGRFWKARCSTVCGHQNWPPIRRKLDPKEWKCLGQVWGQQAEGGCRGRWRVCPLPGCLEVSVVCDAWSSERNGQLTSGSRWPPLSTLGNSRQVASPSPDICPQHSLVGCLP